MKNKQIIDNILSIPKPVNRYADVLKPLGDGRFQVLDRKGQTLVVDSSVNWRRGDGVTVNSDGRIVGKASKFVSRKIYQV